jgi:hypothetical protein
MEFSSAVSSDSRATGTLSLHRILAWSTSTAKSGLECDTADALDEWYV